MGLNFGAAGTLSLVKESGDFNKVSFTGMLAGGVTAGMLVLKASFFVQGEAMISGSVPKAINQPMRALKWLLSSFWRGFASHCAFVETVRRPFCLLLAEKIGGTAFGKMTSWIARHTGTSSDGSVAIGKLTKFSETVRDLLRAQPEQETDEHGQLFTGLLHDSGQACLTPLARRSRD